MIYGNHFFDTVVPLLRHGYPILTSRWYHCYDTVYHSYDTLAPLFRHDGTTVTTLRYQWYDILLPLLRNAGIHHGSTAVTTYRYHCYKTLVPLTRHTGTTATTCWYHCYDRQYAPSKRRWLITSRRGVTSQKNSTSSSFAQMRRRTHTHARTHTRVVAFDTQTQQSYRML